MSHSHQSQKANLLTTCDNNEFSLLAKVSGHRYSCNDDKQHDNDNDCIHSNNDNDVNIEIENNNNNKSKNNKSNNRSNNNFNFSRVSLKAIKNRIKLSNSYSLTFSQSSSSSSSATTTTNKRHGPTTLHDSNIVNNSDSIDNNKNLIKSKSITECLTKDIVVIDGDVVALGDENISISCNESRVNSISFPSNRFIDDNTRMGSKRQTKDKENEADNNKSFTTCRDTNNQLNLSDATNRKTTSSTPKTNNAIENSTDFSSACVTDENDDKSMTMVLSPRDKQTQVIPSSSSSTTSNENNNEIAVFHKGDRRKRNAAVNNDINKTGIRDNDEKHKSDDEVERKLLNVNHRQNTNPFLNENSTTLTTDDDENRQQQPPLQQNDDDEMEAVSIIIHQNESITKHNNEIVSDAGGDGIETRLKRSKRSDNESTSDHHRQTTPPQPIMRQRRATVTMRTAYENDLSAAMLIRGDNSCDKTSHIIKSAIPTCTFQRQDYIRPGESDKNRDINDIDGGVVEKREKKLFKLGKKSGNLFHIPSFGRAMSSSGKPMTPSLRNVNLHYPNKTSTIVDCSSEKRPLGSFPSRAKYQLIKLGQKCKILTHHHDPIATTTTTMTSMATMPRLGAPSRMSVVKTKQQQHHHKRHYYNEVDKSYHLDDFIRKTHLLNSFGENDDDNKDGFVDNEDVDNAIVGYHFDQDMGEELDDDDDDDDSRQHHQKASNCNAADNNSVIYKSYKSEIDLTRNLTYLDAFLNEHFESSKSEQQPPPQHHQQQSHRQHKRSKTKNINYSPKNVHRQNQRRFQDNSKLFSSSSTMINDSTFNDMMMEDEQKKSFCDGNVTSSSFEYTTVIAKAKRKNNREFQQDLINNGGGMRPTTSSSLSSSDYASVFSNGSKEAIKTKLISTPEELVERHEIANKLPSAAKVKKSRARRSSQPIPELTNTIENENENEHFLLFDEANFTELKRSMKTLHPDLYNSVPQFEDINAVDFLADTTSNFRGNNGDCNDSTLINPFSVDPTNSTSAIGKRQLSSSYNVDGSSASIYHQDYLEHFQQQQMLGQRNDIDTSTSSGYMAMMRNGIRPRTSTYSSSSNHSPHNEILLVQDSLLYNNNYNVGSVNDLYGSRKVHSQSISSSSSSYGPHRVIVSKSKKQKGEVVLEYEC